ncbi:polysaccharide deacetylase family protein [soil metagenome]
MVRPPYLLRLAYPGVTWNFSRTTKKIYLTFDDGPVESITPQVLTLLKQYHAKATFFCIGENVKRNPEIYQKIIAEGHSIGNHTWSHKNSWKVSRKAYLHDAAKGGELIQSELFRPPYGKLTPATLLALRKKYRIIMWDVISCDFDVSVAKEKVLHNILKHTSNGSIIVFHDSLKASPSMLYALPQVLAHYSQAGFTFEKIESPSPQP